MMLYGHYFYSRQKLHNVKTETHFMPYYNKRNNKLLRIGMAKQKAAELKDV